MRHKYDTRGIILARAPSGEANAFITLITPELGLVRGRAQGVRRSGAKLAAALATFAESSVVLVRGKEGWRVTGAVLEENWSRGIDGPARSRAARISGLLLRLGGGEFEDTVLFGVVKGFFEALRALPEDAHEAAEILVALRILAALGLDAGEIPGGALEFAPELLSKVRENRTAYIVRINQGIEASGL